MARKGLKKGVFITFEGIEGCGKSTQSRLLCGHLRRRGYLCVHTREPGGTRLGEKVREVLLGSKGVHISDMTELFLFEAARAQIVDEVIRPALARRAIVVCDRFSDATLCYQGCGGKVALGAIGALDRIATGALTPDLTLLLDIDVRTGLKRATKKGADRMESKGVAYHSRVRRGYLKLAKADPARIKVIKVSGNDIGKVQSLIRREVELVIQRHKRAG